MWLTRQFFIACLVGSGAIAGASPLDDLNSPSPEVRKQAAEMIRDHHLYLITPRAHWDEFVATIKEGDLISDVVARAQNEKKEARSLSREEILKDTPRTCVVGFPVDDWWKISCHINDSRIVECKLVKEPKEIFVQPPPGYNGYWRTYRINGETVLHYYVHGRQTGLPE